MKAVEEVEVEEEVRVGLSLGVRDLALVLDGMRRLVGRLSPSICCGETEGNPEGEDPEDLDETADLSGRLQCVLTDFLEPALRDLRAALRRVDQRRSDKAVSLLARAAELWVEVRDHERSAAARVELGLARFRLGGSRRDLGPIPQEQAG
jgi:hypothetical protein